MQHALPRPASATSRPWDGPWFTCAPGELPTLLWIVFLHAATLAGLLLLPLPPWQAPLLALGLLFLGGLGTTVCYHRALAHRAFRLHPVVERGLILSAMFNGSGAPLSWVANHRLHHHASDRPDDISSPHYGGFWWSHLRWLWQAPPAPVSRLCPDLDRPAYRIWDRLQIGVLAVSCAGGLLWLAWGSLSEALAVCLWLGPIRLLWALHAQCAVNSICHLGPITAGGAGSSRNVWWLAPVHLFQGENWHANHHRSGLDPRLGQRWWQVDLGWWAIGSLRYCRLVSGIRAGTK
jgi:fatty-acid desaturase